MKASKRCALQEAGPAYAMFLRRFLSLLLSVLLVAPPLRAQQPQALPPPSAATPGVGAQNHNRVAASAAQIRAVLEKDTGLMVELKRWVAQEATERGQIVDDGDLSDGGIFDRLNRDLEFRAVATRLVQRYGYLKPTLNPDSAEAKEEEMLRQERVRQLARQRELDEEEDRERALERRAAEAEDEEDRRDPRRVSRGRPRSTRERTRSTRDGAELPLESPSITGQRPAPSPGRVVGREQSLLQAGLDPEAARARSGPDRSLGAVGDLEAAYAEARRALLEADSATTMAGREASPEIAVSPRRRPLRERDAVGAAAAEVRLVGRANPFADIPSLYEMYRQVSPRPRKLERFGQDLFNNTDEDQDLLPMDLPVGPDYVIGPGDGLAIDIWGGIAQRLQRTVDQEGRLALPEVGPVLVSGRSLGEVQQTVQKILRTQFRDVSADVSLSRLRTVRVYVVGDVESPGAYDVSSLSTPLNALFTAGGPTARGSLRTLRHYRGKQLVQEVDVYDLLLRGVRSDLKRLQNGDTLLVPPMGAQVTVQGAVRRPAVYELREEKTLEEALALAGGILPTATLRRIQVQRVEAHEKRTMHSLDVAETSDRDAVRKQLGAFAVRDGDDVNIFPIAPFNQDAVFLEGHVYRPGRYSYREGMKLTDLVSSFADMLPEPSTKYAEIIRLNQPDYRPSVETVDLGAVLADASVAPALKPLDTVRIFSRYDFEIVPTVLVGGEVRQPGAYRTAGQIHLRDAIHLAGGLTPDAQIESAQIYRHEPDSKLRIISLNLGEALAGDPIHNLLLQPRDHVVVHRNPAKVDPASVSIKGEVAKPGRYPLTANMSVADLIRMAGGLKRSAYTTSADLTRYMDEQAQQTVGEHQEINIAAALANDPAHNLALRDGDTVAIRQIPGWNDIGASVTVRGEVQYPGVYGIRPGERLSSVLKRAGGFLDIAYPQAAVLERDDVRELQEKSKQDLIRRIEQDTANVRVSLTESPGEQAALQQAALAQRQRVLETLRATPVTGRLVIRLHGNLAEFENSAFDIELRRGDRLNIPKRPNFVVVNGQVYNPNALTYTPRKNAGWYLRQAGGATQLADRKNIFIVRANGEVVSASASGWWGGGVLSTRIEPGDTIIVPEKALGGSTFWKNFLAIAQFVQGGAIAAAIVTRR